MAMKPSLADPIINILGRIGLFLLLWLSFFHFPQPMSVDTDAAWTQVLAHSFKQQWLAGVDYVWTYGPLGYFSKAFASYDADLFWHYVIWWAGLSAVFAGLFINKADHLPLIEKILYFCCLIIIVGPMAGDADAWYFLGIVGLSLLVIQPPSLCLKSNYYLGFLVTISFLFALISLTKFSYALLIIISVSLSAFTLAIFHSRFYGAIFFSLYIICLHIIWFASGQQMNMGSFISQSLTIVRGYSEAMSGGSQPVQLSLALISMAGMLFLIIWQIFKKRHKKQLFISLLFILSIFLSWKAGFTRHNIHASIFFSFMLILVFWVIEGVKVQSMHWLRLIVHSMVIINLVGFFHVQQTFGKSVWEVLVDWQQNVQKNISYLGDIEAYYNFQTQQLNKLQKRYQLPVIRKIVDDAPLDIFPPQQTVAFLNHFHYFPRPIFQGYQAYTPSLLTINAQHYQGMNQPPFVLFALNPLDSRFPMLEDSQALLKLLLNYRPKQQEKNFLLLQHQTQQKIRLKPVFEQRLRLGQIVSLGRIYEKPLLLSITLERSILGDIRHFFYRSPMVILELQTVAGKTRAFRLIPQMAKLPFLVNPLILQTEDWQNWYDNPEQLERVKYLRVVLMQPELAINFDLPIKIRLFVLETAPPISENDK